MRRRLLVVCASPTFWPKGDAGVLQGTSHGARRHAQLPSHPIRGLSPRVELGGPVDIVVLERPAIPLRDATAPDVAEHRRPVHLERGCQLLHGDTLAVGGDQFGLLVRCKASLNREGSDDRVGGANRRLAGALSQHRPQRQHQECRAIYLRKRAASGR